MEIVTANEVADYIIRKMRKSGDLITNLQLQKLVYYAQAWCLAIYDTPLFHEPIQAWVHGPAQPLLYRRFREYGWHPITEDVAKPNLSGDARGHIDDVLKVYGIYNGTQLEVLTHSEAPWQLARGGLPDYMESKAVISHESMRDCYRARIVEANG
jgi:uncharacterized phage-associated protein